ncbi:hypothetical protein ACJRO7_000579 [Eucalyptus globulus]|uniref:F-box domain-containing protein n=1 Tax=Eucalyptus globulus TaxID=34317 RepID=A0ABD3LN80_EUCGL
MASFPVDILTEIFLRISARPLVRFRCRSTKLHKFNLLKYDSDNFSRVQIHKPPNNELSDLNTSFIRDGKKFKLVDSCNGITCFSTFDHKICHNSKIFLWNLSTGENMALPQPSYHVSNLVGFGFNPLSGHPDDFTIVNVNIYVEKWPNYTSQVEVYSFRRNCWKQLGNICPPSLSQHLGNQVIFENFICWCPCFRLDREILALMILYDVAQDAFQKMALPNIMPLGEKLISLLDGCLSVIARNSSTKQCEVWIMKEFGVCESWTKLYTIGASTTIIGIRQPIGFADSGKVFIVNTFYRGLRKKYVSHLALYNIRSQKFETFQVVVDCYDTTQLVTCLESLISLSSTKDVKH